MKGRDGRSSARRVASCHSTGGGALGPPWRGQEAWAPTGSPKLSWTRRVTVPERWRYVDFSLFDVWFRREGGRVARADSHGGLQKMLKFVFEGGPR